MTSWTRLEQGLALISILFMLFTTYAMGGMIFAMIGTIDNIVLQWIITLAVIIVMTISIFGVPILISLGIRLSILNSILSYIYLLIGIPVAKIIGTILWEWAGTGWLTAGCSNPLSRMPCNEFISITMQLFLIIMILIFIFVIPILVATEGATETIKSVTG